MEYNPVGWFEIPVLDLGRAKAFYEAVLGYTLDIHEMNEATMAWFPMTPEAKGAAGALVLEEHYKPSRDGVLVYFTAPDLAGTLAKVEDAGGEVVVPKKSIGEHGWVGIIHDTEGNKVALHSRVG